MPRQPRFKAHCGTRSVKGHFLACLLLTAPCGVAGTSEDYTATPVVVDGGGSRVTSTHYTQTGSFMAGGAATSVAYTAQSGFSAQTNALMSPVFPRYSLSTLKNQALVIPVARVTSRASVPNGDVVTLTGLVDSAGPLTTVASAGGGTVVWAGASITYTPALNFTSADSFKVLLTGASGGIVEAVVSVAVTDTATPSTNNLTEEVIESSGGVVTRVQLTFRGIPSVNYAIERSVDSIAWTVRQTVQADANGKILFVDVLQGSEVSFPPTAFYRTRLP